MEITLIKFHSNLSGANELILKEGQWNLVELLDGYLTYILHFNAFKIASICIFENPTNLNSNSAN